MSRLKELEAKLTLQQRKAALLLVENELMAEARKTQEEPRQGNRSRPRYGLPMADAE